MISCAFLHVYKTQSHTHAHFVNNLYSNRIEHRTVIFQVLVPRTFGWMPPSWAGHDRFCQDRRRYKQSYKMTQDATSMSKYLGWWPVRRSTLGVPHVSACRSDSTCSSAKATRCHFISHRYAKATEGLKDRIVWHGLSDCIWWPFLHFSTFQKVYWNIHKLYVRVTDKCICSSTFILDSYS